MLRQPGDILVIFLIGDRCVLITDGLSILARPDNPIAVAAGAMVVLNVTRAYLDDPSHDDVNDKVRFDFFDIKCYNNELNRVLRKG